MRSTLATYISAARKAVSHRNDPTELAKIREWANKNGYEVSGRGRIAHSVRDAYSAAH